MRAAELRDLNRSELQARAEELNQELFNLQFQHATGQLENAMRLRHVRRDIARVLSVIREQELAGLGAQE